MAAAPDQGTPTNLLGGYSAFARVLAQGLPGALAQSFAFRQAARQALYRLKVG